MQCLIEDMAARISALGSEVRDDCAQTLESQVATNEVQEKCDAMMANVITEFHQTVKDFEQDIHETFDGFSEVQRVRLNVVATHQLATQSRLMVSTAQRGLERLGWAILFRREIRKANSVHGLLQCERFSDDQRFFVYHLSPFTSLLMRRSLSALSRLALLFSMSNVAALRAVLQVIQLCTRHPPNSITVESTRF